MSSAADQSARAEAEIAAQPRRMLDRYELLAEIARGGMGTVYLARLGGAGGFERLFAIKLMHEHLAEEGTFVAMLLDEARTAAHIHHPNAVGIVDVRESAVGYYLVMSYVDGFALSQILEHPALDRETRIRIGTRIVADAAHGLHGAHTARNAKGERLGIVHRDVSPQNVLVGTDGMARIVDFGIALAASRIVASRPGMLKGKPSYMAPEQARGEACDARADVFAAGIVLWEALTGARLFDADMDLATLVKVMECIVEPPTKHVPELPSALADVAMKALAKEPGDRFASARELAVALERAAEAAGLLATAHEVEEVLERLFADEIAARQESLRRRLAESSGDEVPLDRAGLASIPRLVPKKRRDGSPPTPASAERERATRASRPSGAVHGGDGRGGEVRSGVRESATPRTPVRTGQRDVDPLAGTRVSDRPPADTAPPDTAPAADAPVSPPAAGGTAAGARGRAAIGAAIAIAVLALGGALALVLGGGREEATDPSHPGTLESAAPSRPAEPEPIAPLDEPATTPPIEVTAAAPPEASAETDVAVRSDAPPAAAGAERTQATPPTDARAIPRARTREPAARGDQTSEERAPRAPVVETNPYLTH